MKNVKTVLSALTDALTEAAKVNRSAQARPAAILWTDIDSQWEPVFGRLRGSIPGLVRLGQYLPEEFQGPAIWLKCVVAGMVPNIENCDGPYVVYLPGVSRADLRAIESCPRDLQPLAELQYRGVFWSQANTKDWTLSAFLASKNGGLGLDVAQDKATQEALGQALEAGVLLERSLDELKGRQINADWLHSLLAPNPTRDLLVWLNDPESTRNQWNGVRWEVFTKRCKSDYDFDPVADGVLVAAEMLAKGEGKWAAVAELYKDSFTSFPQVFDLLSKVQPPEMGLFPDLRQLAGYPQANEQFESTLRCELSACAAMEATQARVAVLAAEKEHGVRRTWLWSRMGRSPLAIALEYLARVAELSAAAPIGATPTELAISYRQSGWLVDEAALQALSCVHAKTDVDAVSVALRAFYLPWLEEAAKRLQEAAKVAGGLPPMSGGENLSAEEAGVCTLFVDGLRYDVASHLSTRLSDLGEVHTSASWTSMPSVTASGKAWCSPVAQWVSGTPDDVEFEPRVAADSKPLSGYNFRKLLVEKGVQPLDKHETGDPKGRAWTEAGDLDHYGHEHGIRLARDLDTQLSQVVERVSELCQAGWRKVRIVTDHGWLLVPGGLPKSELPKHQAETRWGRCAVLKDTAHGTSLTFGWDWCKDVQVAYAPGVSSFIAGTEYAHGGLSLQECLVPIVELQVSASHAPTLQAAIKLVTWKGLRCVVDVESDVSGLTVDIRTKPALATSSLVANVKAVEAGKANLAVADDEHMGSAAVVVVLGPSGDVLQKQATTVGG
ncbi:BREX-1 system phosphatase PglZ type B [Laribacter hongkongensis]|uniref:BREX-1 system phosphatase PglZ type B n=1 Tax=Laribacter hongkongensis TaxID=168471 RepID=UPI001EFDA2E9|nr:BREX-1 system phosphatase PglZ type B [Laribacter hongkongensis]MCG9093547.1 BREX-1 system phosphatase PglZ type B [Laribacter hongkongensis]